VNQLSHLATRRALATRIAIVAVAAIDILSVCQCHRKRSATALTREELCVAHTSLIDRSTQSLLNLVVSYYLRKSHFQSVCFVYMFSSSAQQIGKIKDFDTPSGARLRRPPQPPKVLAIWAGFLYFH
jgi:hypothetical protein